MTVLCTNVQGLTNNLTELKYVLNKLSPDICFATETHTTEDINNSEIKIFGYKIIRCNSHSNRTGGVIAYVNTNLKIVNITYFTSQINWFLAFDIKINNQKVSVAGVYLSASANKVQVINEFEDWFGEKSENQNILICGDFNINIKEESYASKRLMEICDDSGLVQLVKCPTRITDRSATTIDLCVTNIPNIDVSVCSDDQIADHANLYIRIKGKSDVNKNKTEKKKIQVLHGYSASRLGDEINKWKTEWGQIKHTDINKKFDWLLNNLADSVRVFLKNKTVKIKNNFFDDELESMRQKKNTLYKSAKITNDINKWHEYRIYKNEYKQKIQEKKYQATQRRFDKVDGDQKGMWRVLNSILNDENDQINEVVDGNIIHTEDQSIANKFNEYFVSTINDINNMIPDVEYENIHIEHQNESIFKFNKISISQVKNYIRYMKKRNSRDSFNISVNILSDSVFYIGDILTELINESFDQAIFPSILKRSVIIPIQKVSGTNKINEFRPINTLPILEKLIEKIAYDQFNRYVEENNILCSEQSGFRKTYSCESAINILIDDWKNELQSNNTTIAIFLDFQRAFETVDRGILLQKLQNIGVHESAIKWFQCYLNDRTQIVKINDIFSYALGNILGVPQGSILGPLLFLIYVNNLGKYLKFAKARFFADDTVMYYTHTDIDTCIRKINDDLKNMYNAINQHKLKLNVIKTKAMVISNKKIQNVNDIKISINNEEISIVENVKYLGIWLDNKLKFNEHMNEIIKKIGKKAGVLNRIGHKLNIQQKIKFYKSCIESYTNYCSSILFLCNEKDSKRMQIIQNKCLRNILKVNKYCSSALLLDTLELMSFKQRIIFNVYVNMFKIVKKIWPDYLSSKIIFNYENERKNTLRNRNQIMLPNAKKSFMQNTLLYKGADLYNKLPESIKCVDKIEIFKKKLKGYIRVNYK